MLMLRDKLKEEFRTFPIEMQSPVSIAEMIYKKMDETTNRSYFHCFLAGLDSYKKMNEKDNVFLFPAPIKIMLSASVKDILYHEVWSYNTNITSTQEDYIDYYMEEYEGELNQYLNLYKTSEATRRFTSFKSLIGAISKELAREMKDEV